MKAYTEQWYQQIRPDCSIDHERKVVDNTLLGVLNQEDSINEFMMKETNKKNKPVNTRLLSSEKRPRKVTASTDSALRPKRRGSRFCLAEEVKKMQPEEDIYALVPNEVLREIDKKVAQHMNLQFPPKEYKPKVPTNNMKKSRGRKAAQQMIESYTWSSINLRRQNEMKNGVSSLEVIAEAEAKPNFKEMDPIEKERLQLDWLMKKEFEKKLRDSLVGQALQLLGQQKMHEDQYLEEKRRQNKEHFQEWKLNKKRQFLATKYKDFIEMYSDQILDPL